MQGRAGQGRAGGVDLTMAGGAWGIWWGMGLCPHLLFTFLYMGGASLWVAGGWVGFFVLAGCEGGVGAGVGGCFTLSAIL